MLNMNADFVNVDVMKKIATDDAFRRQLQQDPVNALASVGVEANAGTLPHQILLPSAASAETQGSGPSTVSGADRPVWLGFIG